MRTILIVEDDKTLRQQLKTLLEKYRYQVITTDDFNDTVGLVLTKQPHLVILDVNLPIYDGYHICREVRKKSDVPIIVVTSRDSETDELMSLNLGADQFIAKPYNTQILLAKVEALLKRVYGAVASSTISFGDLILDLAKGQAIYGGKQVELTKNEARILQLLIDSQGGIISRDDIMDALWQDDTFVDDNTLTVNVNRLRKKLSAIGADQLLRTRRGQGYSL
ncbi:MAG: response regulator transcription factor [Candidatus Nomurabacteria bacterium]|jgi:DNA-binding response OmpR family regulator|nr:response regulator transcription factor [Candidatus Nomurabacteria bacterium]